jgi:cullin-associated NEDD8-dissociated protein 1
MIDLIDYLNINIEKHDDVTIQLEALEILSDLLNRFGGLLVSFHANIQEALIPQLLSQRLAVRKRAITAISYLTMCCSQTVYVRIIEFLLEELARNASDSTAKTYIQCIAAISRQAGHRFGENLERVMPLIVKYCNSEDDELKEYCIQAFESFVRRCPKEISPHVSTV